MLYIAYEKVYWGHNLGFSTNNMTVRQTFSNI